MTQKLLDSFRGLADSVIQAVPKVLTGLVLIVVAVVVAKLVEKILRAILTRVKFDNLAQRAGLDVMLQRIGLRQELNYFLPRLVYFLLLFLFAKTAADALGLVAISDALGSFFAYLPNLIAALLLIVIGTAASQFAGQAVTQAGEDAGLDFAPALGRVVGALILFIVGIMAVTQLKIDTEMVRLFTAFCLAGFALAFGLSFGLGSREVTRNILAGFYARKFLKIGEQVEIKGERGTVTAVTSTHTLIESEDKTISISNGTFLEEISRQ